jgi:hypothetical protein
MDDMAPGSAGPSSAWGPSSWKIAAVAIVVFIVLFWLTVPATTADTPVYVGHILTYYQHLPNASPFLLWEFGHLLWRPLGYGLWLVERPFLSSWSGGNPVLEITAVLIGVNFVVGVILTPLLFFLSRRLGLPGGVALVVTAGFMLCSVILYCIHSGMSYNFGLAAQLAGLLLILQAVRTPRRSVLYAVLGGVALALSVLVWFPYVLTVPAVLLAGWIVDPARRPEDPFLPAGRMRVIALASAAAALVGLAIFGVGAAIDHITSYAVLRQWIVDSAHGVNPERRLLRFPTGVTRSFLDLGNDGTIMKRFTLGDPYASVGKIDLIRAGVWKVILVFTVLSVLCVTLARRRETWPALAVLAVGFLPSLAFAVLLFETSESARYEPAYPSLLVAVCAVLLMPRNIRVPRWFLAAFLAVLAIVNLKAYTWDLRSIASLTTDRVMLLHEHTAHNGIAFLLSYRDPVSSYLQKLPFSRLNQQAALPLFHVIETGNISVVTWRSAAACRILQAWDAGGEAWLSTRLVAQRPKPDWNWTERDDSRVHWTDLPAFFTRLETDGGIGGEDGFLRVTPTANNRRALQESCASPTSR